MKRIFLLSILAMMLINTNTPPPSQAQMLNMPLVMLISGDLWTWNPQTNALVQLTTWGYNFKPVMSPSGDWVAYKSWANITVAALTSQGSFYNPTEPAGNIWLIDPFTGDAMRIADQPADATLNNLNAPDKYIARSNPVWSPDGSAIAWTEFHIPESSNKLVIYNLANRTARVIVNDLPVGYEQAGPVDVAWGDGGFVYPVTRYDAQGNNFVNDYHFYDVNGRNYNTVTTPAVETPEQGILWFTGSQFNGVAIVNSGELVKLIDPQTSSVVDFMGILVGYSLWQSRTQGNYVTFDGYADMNNYVFGLNWMVQSSDGRYLGAIGTSLGYADVISKMAIAPDGLSVAYIAEDSGVLVWQAGRMVQLPVSNAEFLAWSPILWTTNYPIGG